MYAHRSDLNRDHHFPGQVLVRVSVPPHPLTAPTLVGSSAFATVVGCRTVQAGLDEKQSVEVRISAPMVEPLIIFANGSCGTNAPEKLVFVDAPATARYGESDCGGAQVFDADLVHLDASMSGTSGTTPSATTWNRGWTLRHSPAQSSLCSNPSESEMGSKSRRVTRITFSRSL